MHILNVYTALRHREQSMLHPHFHYKLTNQSNFNNEWLKFAGDTSSYLNEFGTIFHAGPVAVYFTILILLLPGLLAI